jgi:hypothetical protein
MKWLMERFAPRVAAVIAATQGGWENVWVLVQDVQDVFEIIWNRRNSLPEDTREFKKLLFHEAVDLAVLMKAVPTTETPMPQDWVDIALEQIIQKGKEFQQEFWAQVESGEVLEEEMAEAKGRASRSKKRLDVSASTPLENSGTTATPDSPHLCFNCHAPWPQGRPTEEEAKVIAQCHKKGRRGFFTILCSKCNVPNGIAVFPPIQKGLSQPKQKVEQKLAELEAAFTLLPPESLHKVIGALEAEMEKLSHASQGANA